MDQDVGANTITTATPVVVALSGATPVDFDVRVGQYVALRDKIKQLDDEHKKRMEPYKETLEQLNGVLLHHLNGVGADSVSTGSGTVYRSERKSASIADRAAFWSHVVVTANWDLLDYKANVTEVVEYIGKNNTPPPGVTFSSAYVVGVRRK